MLGSIEFLVYLGLVGILVVWFILPLVPAILLYWLFPDSRIKAEGVLANFKVNAAGAFGGYLVLFAAMIPFVRPAIDYVGSFQHSCWTISGKLTITDANNADIYYPPLFNAVRARTVPDTVAFDDPEYVITVRADESGGLPPITVYLDKMPEFTPQVLDIESGAGKRDTFHKKLSNVGLVIKRTTVNATFDARPQ